MNDLLENQWLNKHCVKSVLFGVFLVRIFPHSDWIRRDATESPKAGKYGPENSEYAHFSRSGIPPRFIYFWLKYGIKFEINKMK